MALHALNNGIDFAFGERLQAVDGNAIKTAAADIRVATNITADANVLLNLSNGTTYRTAASFGAAGVRVIALPITPTPTNARVWFKFTHGATGNNFEVRVDNGAFNGQLVLTGNSAAGTESFAEVYWDGSTWRTLGTRSSGTITVTQ